jgi:cytochrome c
MDTKNTKLFLQRAFVMLASLAPALVTSRIIATAAAQDHRASVWDGVYTNAQADRGRALYDRHCRTCHGRDLEGQLALPTEGQWSARPPLRGWEFRANWNQLTLRDLSERIRISMPQNAPGTLRRPQVADILAYVLQQNGYPSGRREMPEQPQLDTIAIEWW